MTKIIIDETKKLGKIKPMHGVGQPPLMGVSTGKFSYLTEANIPYSRLHDVGGWFGKNMFVDIPNIFRDFDADENDPNSYDFTFTDILVKGLVDAGCEPYYRLGVTIENFAPIKAYRIYPPKDFHKWARICEHIIRHYNEGWADGFHFNIKYWEIWNEPEFHYDIMKNAMWRGTKEEYFELYRISSTHLKECFGDTIKIGGGSSNGFHRIIYPENNVPGKTDEWYGQIDYIMEFFYDFIDFVKRENLPLDFFAHHIYENVQNAVKMELFCEKYFEEKGLSDVEIHINEWNTRRVERYIEQGTSLACADMVATMCYMQNTKAAVMCYYDAKIGTSAFGGLFNPATRMPYCAYYGFKAFGKLYTLGTQIECVCDNEKVVSIAATDGTTVGVLMSNIGEDTEIELSANGKFKAFLIDEKNSFSSVDMDDNRIKLKQNQVLYFEN